LLKILRLADTVGILIDLYRYSNCATDLENEVSMLKCRNSRILEGQSGTGDKQTMIVWTISGMDLSTIASNLQEFSSGLPYT
jgi:hypothetical protein